MPVNRHLSDDFSSTADVVIVGSGFTGLSAALELARAGRDVLVLERDSLGFGASSRNGGMIGSGHHLTYSGLSKKYGEKLAREIIQEGLNALAYTSKLIVSEKLDCDYTNTGRFRAACRAAHFKAMKSENEILTNEFGLNATVIEKSDLPQESGSNFYHGGIVFHDHGGLHPAKFHAGLLKLAREAGARVVGHCNVRAVNAVGNGFEIDTAAGIVRAGDVIAATNGYIDRVFQKIRNRIVPAFSYIIATEPLSPNLVSSAIPNGRMIVESRDIHSYYRPSPDGRRILFGGRAALRGIDEKASARFLHKTLVALYPQLQGVKLTHSWKGQLAFTRDTMPHMGQHKGIYYALGYCGSGVAMAPYLGHRIAQKMLGTEIQPSPFEKIELPAIPFYNGVPWFLPLMDMWRRIKSG